VNPSEACYRQAASDLEMYELLSSAEAARLTKDGGIPACHSLHYLQMALEEVAKAILASYAGDFRLSHKVVYSLFTALNRKDAWRALDYSSYDVYQAKLRGMKSLAKEIEDLHPEGNQPNVEYPWPTPGSESPRDWIAPVEYPFGLHDRLRKDHHGRELIGFVKKLLERRLPYQKAP
jgi:hypothetical protein